MKIALAMIVKPTKDEALFLEQCLTYVSKHVDGIFITLAGPNPANKEVEAVCSKFKAKVSRFKWINDFAAARNFNFKQVSKEYDYILWLDADDILRVKGNLKEIIAKKKADCYSLSYAYSFDEYKNPTVVHLKTQIVKNDGSFEWAGQLHEDFKFTREVNLVFLKDVERMHMSTPEHFEQAKERNVEVAKSQIKLNPKDPRSYWNLANSYKATNNNKLALENFQIFLEKSKSEDEKYIAYQRMAEIFWIENRNDEALQTCRYMIGLKPEFPDGYYLMGSILYNQKQYQKAATYYLMGLAKKPPIYSIIVYNPRDYDFNPLMNLAKCYFNLSLPQMALTCLKGCQKINPKDTRVKNLIKEIEKETKKYDEVVKFIEKIKKLKDKKKIKKELDSIPAEFQSHPAVCSLRNTLFIKETSTGKDLVYYCGFTQDEWTPETARTKGIGGSEEAVINLTREFAKQGYNVTVYNNCGHKELEFDGVKYKPFWTFNYRDKQDYVILWRSLRMLDFNINSERIYVDLHDVIPEQEFLAERLDKITKIFVKSEFHRSLFPKVTDDKFIIVPNGINIDEFKNKEKRDPYLLINTSSPDRSLVAFIDCFREIKKKFPKARAAWAYGWNVYEAVYANDSEMMEWKNEIEAEMKKLGIINLGRIGHDKVNKLYQQAGIFFYPSEFAEIDCISLTKAIVGGAYPITTDFSAMGEKNVDGQFIHSEKTKDDWCLLGQHDFSIKEQSQKKQFIDRALYILKSKAIIPKKVIDNYKEKFDWKKIAETWMKNLC